MSGFGRSGGGSSGWGNRGGTSGGGISNNNNRSMGGGGGGMINNNNNNNNRAGGGGGAFGGGGAGGMMNNSNTNNNNCMGGGGRGYNNNNNNNNNISAMGGGSSNVGGGGGAGGMGMGSSGTGGSGAFGGGLGSGGGGFVAGHPVTVPSSVAGKAPLNYVLRSSVCLPRYVHQESGDSDPNQFYSTEMFHWDEVQAADNSGGGNKQFMAQFCSVEANELQVNDRAAPVIPPKGSSSSSSSSLAGNSRLLNNGGGSSGWQGGGGGGALNSKPKPKPIGHPVTVPSSVAGKAPLNYVLGSSVCLPRYVHQESGDSDPNQFYSTEMFHWDEVQAADNSGGGNKQFMAQLCNVQANELEVQEINLPDSAYQGPSVRKVGKF